MKLINSLHHINVIVKKVKLIIGTDGSLLQGYDALLFYDRELGMFDIYYHKDMITHGTAFDKLVGGTSWTHSQHDSGMFATNPELAQNIKGLVIQTCKCKPFCNFPIPVCFKLSHKQTFRIEYKSMTCWRVRHVDAKEFF